MSETLYCEVCDRDAIDTVILARWHEANVCLDCLHHHHELEAEGWFEDDEEALS